MERGELELLLESVPHALDGFDRPLSTSSRSWRPAISPCAYGGDRSRIFSFDSIHERYI